MRYAIGCSIIHKKTKKPIEGIYINSEFGGAYICCDETNDTTRSCLKIFNDIKDAIVYANSLSKSYEKEFDYRAKTANVDRDKYRFYPVKVDSNKFPLKLIRRMSIAGKDHINWEEWEFKKR